LRAAIINSYGGPEVLELADRPEPRPGPRDVLIEVRAAAVNPVDTKLRSGAFRGAVRWPMPRILGYDVSGIVRAVGAKVTRFRAGDEVYSSPTHKREGCYAELVAVDESACARKPKNIDHQRAAGIPMVALTAWEALVTKANVQPGAKVFIQAGAGGVGSVAIQLAKHLGAYVATSCSESNVELVRSLGADQVIDYRKEKIEDVLSGFDFALEALDRAQARKTLRVLKNGGFLAMLNADIPESVKKNGPILGLLTAVVGIAGFVIGTFLSRRVRVSHVLRRSDGATLEKITELVERGAIRPVVDSVHPLEKIVEAHRRSESGRARGKIIVAVS
jgi:NADPH:quinone reductase-like Zn-dependent oxidoreductase